MTNNQLTDERLAELVAFKPLPSTDINSATRDEWMAMAAELQERRKADSEPVAWLWSRDDERDVSLTPPDDDDDAADAIECGWTATPLYRHAQQSVVPDRSIFEKWWESQNGAPLDGWDSLRATDGYCDDGIDGQFEAWNAAMLNHPSSIQLNTGAATGTEIKHPSSNSPVIPEGYVMVPMRLTAENGAKGVLSGEFSETQFVNCPECFGDDECETCDGSGRIEIKVPVSWTTIKEIWIKGVEYFAAAPQENN